MGKPTTNVIEMKSVDIRRLHNIGKRHLFHFNQVVDEILDVHDKAIDIVAGITARRIRAVDIMYDYEDRDRTYWKYRGWLQRL